MNSAAYVDEQINILKNSGIPLSDAAWKLGLLCVGWPYIFGDAGQECTPSHRQAVYNKDPSKSCYQNVKKACKALNGSTCSGCKWYPNGKRVRGFDCRGFTRKILYWIYGWTLKGAGCTSQWNDETNWSAKGTIDTLPKDKLVCLFYPEKNNKKVMAHTGLYYKGETLECSSGVQHSKSLNKKWTHWALPICVDSDYKTPVSEKEPASTGTPSITYPTIRQGAKGEVVTQLQTFLAKTGSGLQIDGIFGSGTASAVRAFQNKYDLVVDGIVGPKTWSKLLEVAGNIKIEAPQKEELVSLKISNLKKSEADELMKKYPKAVIIN